MNKKEMIIISASFLFLIALFRFSVIPLSERRCLPLCKKFAFLLVRTKPVTTNPFWANNKARGKPT